MASLKITYFWSNLLAWRYQHNLPLYHAFVIDMVLANGAEIPASSEVSMFAKANIELRERREWGFQLHRRAAGPRT